MVRVRPRMGLLVTMAFATAVAAYVAVTLPRASITLDAVWPATHKRGAIHIHTSRSDGSGSVDDVAAAAARAGLDFVVLSDHGDATRLPDAPAYRYGVLVIDAVEISSREGHVLALGLWEASPYPLGGAARDVVEDVKRLGGLAVATHPDSPKPELRWRAGNVAYDGLEWLNADSEWRDQPAKLLGLAFGSLLRPAESIAATFSRPTASLRRWDQAARQRPVFGIAAVDAHARIGWRADDEPRQRTALRLPTYESMFRALSQVVVLEHPFTGQASADARTVVAHLGDGQSYSLVRALAEPASLDFSADVDGAVAQAGARVSVGGEPVRWRAGVSGAPGARVWLMRNGERIASGSGLVVATRSDPGVYRVEVDLPGVGVPWIVSNPITLVGRQAGDGGGDRPTDEAAGVLRPVEAGGPRWSVERDPLSRGELRVNGAEMLLQVRLGDGPSYGQYVALVLGGHDTSPVDAVTFVGSASRPMRVAVQVRLPNGREGERWRQTVYFDQTPRAVTLRVADFEPVEQATRLRPLFVPLHSLLFVVDTTNTKPGTEAEVTIRDLQLRVPTDLAVPEATSGP